MGAVKMGYHQEPGETAMWIGSKPLSWVALAIALVAGMAARADVVTVANPSFEDPALPPGTALVDLLEYTHFGRPPDRLNYA